MRSADVLRERMMRCGGAPLGQRQLVRFYRGDDGAERVEIAHEHDRTSVIQRPATAADRERWAEEFAAFKAGGKADAAAPGEGARFPLRSVEADPAAVARFEELEAMVRTAKREKPKGAKP